MRVKMPADISGDKGASAVEFAIVLPVLLLVLFGIIEWGLYMYNRQVITNAAREGARYGVLCRQPSCDETKRFRNVEDSAIEDRVMEWVAENTGLITFGSDEITKDDITIVRPEDKIDDEIECPSDATNEFSTGCDLKVIVVYKYAFLFLSTISVGPLDIIGEATMKME